jgi:catechol 2,3-dioxygenase-like lactoylglutathione lyase family enzyme
VREAEVSVDKRSGEELVARRFLHVCLNTTLSAPAVAFHRAIADLGVGMATGVQHGAGSVLDIGADGSVPDQPFVAETTFLYDHRGPRVAGALEIVHWMEPATTGETYPVPTRPGLHALSYSVPSVAEHVGAAGAEVEAELDGGLLRPTERATYVRDPDGVLVELLEAAAPAPAESRGIRLSCRDLDATVAWYGSIGFGVVEPPTTVTVAAAALGGDGPDVTVRAARLALAEEPTFALTVVAHPDAEGTSWDEPYHRGLYRMALRVENMDAAAAELKRRAVVFEGPKWIPLPGTKIGGMSILFLRDPDGVMVEFVERPTALIGKATPRPAGRSS